MSWNIVKFCILMLNQTLFLFRIQTTIIITILVALISQIKGSSDFNGCATEGPAHCVFFANDFSTTLGTCPLCFLRKWFFYHPIPTIVSTEFHLLRFFSTLFFDADVPTDSSTTTAAVIEAMRSLIVSCTTIFRRECQEVVRSVLTGAHI